MVVENLPAFSKACLVAGVNGVGKDTVLAKVSETNPGIAIPFRGSASLMAWLGINPGDYKSLREVPEQQAVQAFDGLMQYTLSRKDESARKALLINAHLFNIRKGSMFDRCECDWFNRIDALILITADRDTLLDRIESDTRNRELFPDDATPEIKMSLVDHYLARTLEGAKGVSQRCGIPLYQIENPKGELQQAGLTLVHKIENILEGNQLETRIV